MRMPKPTPSNIQQLRLLPEDQRVAALAGRREDQWFDRKSRRVKARDLADRMIGFANAEGGLIVIGIHDRDVEGVAGDVGWQNDWRQAPKDFTRPSVPARFELVSCINQAGVVDDVMIVEVEASEHVHENNRGDVFLRIGDENRKLNPVEVQELRYDKGTTFFDGSPVAESTKADLAEPAVEAYLRAIGGTTRPEEALLSRGLLAKSKGQTVPTTAGILTLGSDPQRFLPEARLRLLRYRGTTRELGERSNVVADIEIVGDLRTQIITARRHLRRWLGAAVRLGTGGRFRAGSLIPEAAWLEAVVNAVVHRSYSIGGDHVRVSLFADRLEVESPGRLPGLVRIETIRSTRFARNPRIARAILELGFGRELGEGVDRMFEEMERAGLPDPVYRQGPASVSVALLMDPLGARMLRLLPTGSERLVEHILANGQVTTAEAKAVLGVSVNTARKYLAALVDAGYLEHERRSLRDPHGYLRLARSASLDAGAPPVR